MDSEVNRNLCYWIDIITGILTPSKILCKAFLVAPVVCLRNFTRSFSDNTKSCVNTIRALWHGVFSVSFLPNQTITNLSALSP